LPLQTFHCKSFRCLSAVELEPHAAFTLVTGPNASGKTSLLEALAYLGRGRSFRGATARDLVQHGGDDFLLRAELRVGQQAHKIGVQNGKSGLLQSIDGDREGGTAALAALLPLQVIDPEVHQLVGGAPEQRRRFLDWMTFHVEPAFLDRWRRYRRVLKQRNALLKSGGGGIEDWDREFCELAALVEASRRDLVERALPALSRSAETLLGLPVSFEYARGWSPDRELADQLAEGRGRDLQTGSTQAGPHRADLRLKVDERVARKLVSRGQQKLLACSMVLASVAIVSEALGRKPLLLLDDPAAELDQVSLARLMAAVLELQGQVIATALTAEALPLPDEYRMFHVEQGALSALD